MKILITGVGGPTPLGIAKSLRLKFSKDQIYLIGVDEDPLAPGLYNTALFDKTFLIPNANSPEYWNVIHHLVKNEKIDYAFVVPETEVIVWSKRQSKFDLPCKSLIPDYNIALTFYDKYKTYEHLKNTDLVPNTISISNSADYEQLGNDLGYPYWVRGGSGCGAIGSLKINKIKDIINWFNLNPKISNFMASEFLPGRNTACKLLFENGYLVRAACAQRVGYLLSNAAPSGVSGMCAYGRLLNDNKLIDVSKKAVSNIFTDFGLKPHGLYTIDLKDSKEGIPKITEINIRHVSFTYAFALGGANLVSDSLRLMNNDPSFDKTYLAYSFEKEYTFIRGVDSELFLLEDNDIKSNIKIN